MTIIININSNVTFNKTIDFKQIILVFKWKMTLFEFPFVFIFCAVKMSVVDYNVDQINFNQKNYEYNCQCLEKIKRDAKTELNKYKLDRTNERSMKFNTICEINNDAVVFNIVPSTCLPKRFSHDELCYCNDYDFFHYIYRASKFLGTSPDDIDFTLKNLIIRRTNYL